MAKEEDIILIISKSFSKQRLSNKELKLCKDLSVTKLITDFGLNDIDYTGFDGNLFGNFDNNIFESTFNLY